VSDAKTKTNDKELSSRDNRILELKKLLVYYKEITETIREPFIILDKDLCVVSANPAFYRKFKVLKKNTEGRKMYELGDRQWNAPELRDLLERILPRHRVLNNYEITLDFPTLGRKTMLLNARQVDSKELILLAMEDVTSQKLIDTTSSESTLNLVKQRDRLQALNDAKDEFIMLASHQLRTPATVVKQYVGMLAQNYAGEVTKDQMRMLDIAFASNERQLEIIEDLLRIARVDAGKVYLDKSSCDVVVQVESAIQMQAILFKSRGQSIVLNTPKKRVMASIDPKLMLMVLENLLDNAGKYSRHGARVTIDIKQGKHSTAVSIRDTGVGIRKNDLHRLFKKFSRIDNPLSNSVKGTGLGLYWAKKILDLHGGTIEASSELDVGSAFVVKIPIVAKELPQEAPVREPGNAGE